MRYARFLLLGLLALVAALALGDQPFTGAAQPVSASAPAIGGGGVPDPIDPGSPQPGEDMCPLVAEDLDGVDDQDGCPDSDVSVSAETDEEYTVTVSTVVTKTVDIWVQNGNYPTDILAHVLSVSTVGACEVSLLPAAGDQFLPFVTDEDGDTVVETFYYMLEWELSLGAGESDHTTRDYEVLCSLPGVHSFEIQVDVVPMSPVQEEDVVDLSNVHKSFPVVTVISAADLDSDGDGFSDQAESFVGTKPTAACAATAAADDEEPDASPADFNDNQSVNIVDVLAMKPVFRSTEGDGTYVARNDLTADGAINISDVLTLKPYFGTTCN